MFSAFPEAERKKEFLHLERGRQAPTHLWYRGGVDVTVIALWLGHESATTTLVYLRADMELKQRALDRTTSPGAKPGRYQPPDDLLAFLNGL